MIDALATPEERFVDLPDWSYRPKLVALANGLRLAVHDTGPATGRTFLCLHGQPTWSYLYRRMIPVFADAGHRVVAPDFTGFGRSDKPRDEAVYTFEFHRDCLLELVETLDLRDIVLVVQDWGGLIGLTLPMAAPHRYRALLVMNTTLGTGDEPLSAGFLAWRAFCRRNPDLDIGGLMGRACPHLSPAERAAYAAPYPDATYKAGVWRFPELVPERPDDPGAAISREARAFWSQRWSGPSLMAVGTADPVLGMPVMSALRRHIRGCPEPLEIAAGGHFLQEWGEPIARAALQKPI